MANNYNVSLKSTVKLETEARRAQQIASIIQGGTSFALPFIRKNEKLKEKADLEKIQKDYAKLSTIASNIGKGYYVNPDTGEKVNIYENLDVKADNYGEQVSKTFDALNNYKNISSIADVDEENYNKFMEENGYNIKNSSILNALAGQEATVLTLEQERAHLQSTNYAAIEEFVFRYAYGQQGTTGYDGAKIGDAPGLIDDVDYSSRENMQKDVSKAFELLTPENIANAMGIKEGSDDYNDITSWLERNGENVKAVFNSEANQRYGEELKIGRQNELRSNHNTLRERPLTLAETYNVGYTALTHELADLGLYLGRTDDNKSFTLNGKPYDYSKLSDLEKAKMDAAGFEIEESLVEQFTKFSEEIFANNPFMSITDLQEYARMYGTEISKIFADLGLEKVEDEYLRDIDEKLKTVESFLPNKSKIEKQKALYLNEKILPEIMTTLAERVKAGEANGETVILSEVEATEMLFMQLGVDLIDGKDGERLRQDIQSNPEQVIEQYVPDYLKEGAYKLLDSVSEINTYTIANQDPMLVYNLSYQAPSGSINDGVPKEVAFTRKNKETSLNIPDYSAFEAYLKEHPELDKNDATRYQAALLWKKQLDGQPSIKDTILDMYGSPLYTMQEIEEVYNLARHKLSQAEILELDKIFDLSDEQKAFMDTIFGIVEPLEASWKYFKGAGTQTMIQYLNSKGFIARAMDAVNSKDIPLQESIKSEIVQALKVNYYDDNATKSLENYYLKKDRKWVFHAQTPGSMSPEYWTRESDPIQVEKNGYQALQLTQNAIGAFAVPQDAIVSLTNDLLVQQTDKDTLFNKSEYKVLDAVSLRFLGVDYKTIEDEDSYEEGGVLEGADRDYVQEYVLNTATAARYMADGIKSACEAIGKLPSDETLQFHIYQDNVCIYTPEKSRLTVLKNGEYYTKTLSYEGLRKLNKSQNGVIIFTDTDIQR